MLLSGGYQPCNKVAKFLLQHLKLNCSVLVRSLTSRCILKVQTCIIDLWGYKGGSHARNMGGVRGKLSFCTLHLSEHHDKFS